MLGKFFKIGCFLGLVAFFLLFNMRESQGWGFWAHKRINRLAVFTLPPEMIGFYKKHLEYVTEHAIDPDKRRYSAVGEDKKHYIDIDHYGEYPFKDFPRDWDEAISKYSEDTIREYGILPWNLQATMEKLTRAFRDNNTRRILRHSVDIGHYIGDAHVPLHTTENYNGQLTGQKGIHGFWESRCPELFADDNYDYFVGKAVYLDDPEDQFWDIIMKSASHVQTVLDKERELTLEFSDDKKYAFAERNNSLLRTYSEEFSKAYEQELNGMIEDRMRNAILNIGSVWYTAWVNAGKPNLDDEEEITLTKEEEEAQKKLDEKSNSGKIIGRDHGK